MNYKDLIPSEPRWMESNIILLGKTGSHAYGTATESSDLDFKGVCIPPKEYFLGLNSFDGYDKSGGKNFKNKAGDMDVTILHINNFVRDATAGVPNNLELLFLDEEDYLYVNEYGQMLIDMRKHFLSKQIMKKFGGYAKSQAQKMQNLKSNGKPRQDLIEKYGYDTKFFIHTVRLLQMAIETLITGDLKVKRPNANFLVSLRMGLYTLDEALEYINRLEAQLQIAYSNSTLPEQPNYDFINAWLTEFNLRYIAQRTNPNNILNLLV